MARGGDPEKELVRALSHDNIPGSELVIPEEPIQYDDTDVENDLAPEKSRNIATRTSSETSELKKTTTAATISTNASIDAESGTKQTAKIPWYKKLNPLKAGKTPPIPSERTVCPEYQASFLSLLFFQWINPLMTVGYKRPLEVNDIWTVNPDRSSETLVAALTKSFERRAANGERNALLWALYDTRRSEFLLGGLCSLIAALLQVFSPFTTRYLIQYATDAYYATQNGSPAPDVASGVGLVIGITAMQVFQSTSMNHFIYRGMIVGAQSRAVLINAIFEKSIKLSGRAKAGGKAASDESTKDNANSSDEANKTRPGLSRVISSVLHPKGGAKVTPDAATGIAGDGTGWNNGKIVNLMSVDTYRVDQASGMFHILWTAPIQIALVLVVLCVNLGYSALSGYALLVISIPLLTKAIKSLLKRRTKINKVTDQRVTLTQEILASVRFVKFFGWELSFLDRLKDLRKNEIRAIQVLLAIRNAINALSMSAPVFASMIAFITYSRTDNSLNPARIFSSLALFNSLRMPLNLLPLVIGQATDASVSLNRIQEFLLAEEQQDEVTWSGDMKEGIEVTHASFTWERTATQTKDDSQIKKELQEAKKARKEEKRQSKLPKMGEVMPTASPSGNDEAHQREGPFQLTDMNFTIGRNELVAVIGSVGSGKTSLLAALAGDMRQTGGNIAMAGTRAFCPQYAWIQNATLKENVLFGKPSDTNWYNEVLDACALRPDLDVLPAGDRTEIGERGITLSGGQKQRLNIARAIYFNADIILMDDPLSAVDAHVGRHIMDKAICGILKDKCRILATHQLHVLNRCDRIIWMEDGRIQAIDTFANLMSNSVDFQKLMATTAQEDEKQDRAEETEALPVPKTTAKRKTKKAKALMQVEERAVKSVGWHVWKAYLSASGTRIIWPLIFLSLVCSQGANITTSLWLSYWVSKKFPLTDGVYIGVYATLGTVQALLMFLFATLLSTAGTNASRTMLLKAMTRVLHAPMSFFDTTPLGRITNRFSKDIDSMDNNLTDAMRMYFLTMGMIVSVFALIIAYYYYFTIALVPLLLLFVFAASYYRSSARELKRHEAVLRSDVFSRFSESVSGVASIRAYGLQEYFTNRIREAVDGMNSAYYLTFANQRWLSTRLDFIGNTMVFVVGMLVVFNQFKVNPSIAGLVLSYILSIVQMMQFTIRQLAEVENNMNSTERLHYYGSEIDQEAPLKLAPVPEIWPQSGGITFDKVEMRYRPELPLVLRGLNFHVQGGERIGIVGRTGAGKSSIMSALFRLTELSSGHIKIDDIDISKVGLHDLRSRLSIIPQDPTLFRGTIRSNLDPFNEHTDLELWSALRQADLLEEDRGSEPSSPSSEPSSPTVLTEFSEKLPEKVEVNTSTVAERVKVSKRIHLDSTVEEEGLNFSLGQRQLMALARALVRNSQIIVCDEATSSVDFETDEKIQRTMRTGFAGKTVLCIAHRLKTIIGYDRICVMDQGVIAELDTPENLFAIEGGIFRGMCEKSGIGRSDILREKNDAL